MLTAKSSWCVRPTEVEEKVENSDLPLLSVPGLVTRYQVLAYYILNRPSICPSFPLSPPLYYKNFFFAWWFKPYKHENQGMSAFYFFLTSTKKPISSNYLVQKAVAFLYKMCKVVFTATKVEPKIKFNFIWSSDWIVFLPLTANHFSLSFQRGTWYGGLRQGAGHF